MRQFLNGDYREIFGTFIKLASIKIYLGLIEPKLRSKIIYYIIMIIHGYFED